jgi:hypothetical protein
MNDYFLAALFLALPVWYLAHVAARLDRLHDRINAAWSSLNTALARRSAVTLELAANDHLDGISRALLADSAHSALLASDDRFDERLPLENALTEVLINIFDADQTSQIGELDGDQAESLQELAIVCQRLALTKTFHDGAVHDALSLRARRFVRIFHLFGHAKAPSYLELDVRIPKGFSGD